MNKTMIREALANCKGFKKQQHKSKDPMVKAYQKVRPKTFLDILASAHGPAKSEARELFVHMAESKWEIRATLHEGGHPDNPEPDLWPHFTVKVGSGNKNARHVRCRIKKGRIFVVEITK